MTSTLASAEAVDCRRFLSAWARAQASEELHLDGDVVQQYRQLAQHFQRLLQDNDELKALEKEVAPVLEEIAALSTAAADAEPVRRVPRAKEIVAMRQERTRAIRAQNLPAETEKDSEKAPAVKELDAAQVQRSDLDVDDFRSMLEVSSPTEEKLSTKAIRKRLGLTDRSGVQATASETVAREEQESIQSDMMSLAKQLKDRTQNINQTLAEDVKILDAVGQSAESNTALLDRENAKLKEQLASSIGLWTSLWLVAMVVIVFVVTYFYMKLFSRRW